MRRFSWLLAVAALAACETAPTDLSNVSGSSSGATGASGSSGSSSGASGSSSGSAGGTSGSSSGSTSASSSSGGSTGSYAGYVLFNAITLSGVGGLGGGLGNQHIVTAAFGDASQAAALDPSSCTDGILDTNGCCFRDTHGLPAPDGGSIDGGAMDGGVDAGSAPVDAGAAADAGSLPTAGELDLTADRVAMGSMQPGAAGAYPPFTSGTWNPGQLMAVSAVGAEIPAFTAAVLAPTSATVNSPDVTAFPFTQISTSAALVVSWTGSGDKAEVLLVNQDFSKSLTCYGANNGQRTLSSVTLSTYFADESGRYGGLLVAVGNVQVIDGGSSTVTVAADTAAGGVIQFGQ